VLFLLATHLFLYLLIFVCFFCLFLCGAAEKIGESWKLWQPNTEDPLLAAVDLLESNWKLVQNVLQLTHRVLTRIFVRLWLKKKEDMLGDNLRKLLEAFDTPEDPVLAMKRTSVKQGVEGAIALAQLHGKEVDWEKIGSSPAHPLSEMLGFFKKAKKYVLGIVSLITPSAASLTSAPGSLTPLPGAAAADSSAPSTTTKPAAEVA
jgi:small-conductance mechanosensitive channel